MPNTISDNYLLHLTPAQWRRDTQIMPPLRGSRLQQLDAAVLDYCTHRHTPTKCLAVTDGLRKAFEVWALHKIEQAGRGVLRAHALAEPANRRIWEKDRHNHSNAMTHLFNALIANSGVGGSTALSREELEAIRYMRECTEKLAAKLFAGKTAEFRLLESKASGRVSAAAFGALGVKSGVSSAQEVMSWIKSLLRTAAAQEPSADTMVELFIESHLPAVSAAVKELMPILGTVASGATFTYSLVTAVKKKRASDAIARAPFSEGQSAVAAIKAVTQLLQEENKILALRTSKAAAVFGASLATELFPGAQAAGAGIRVAAAAANLLDLFYHYMKDWQLRARLTAYLATIQDPDTAGNQKGRLVTSVEMFREFPLLGAYWVLIADTSSVIGICADDITSKSFIAQVEHISRTHLLAVRNAAAKLVAGHRVVIPELLSHRLIAELGYFSGTPQSNFWVRVVDPIVDSFRSLVNYRRLFSKLPPPDWKDRLVGISSEEQAVIWHPAPQKAVVGHPAPTQTVVWHDAPTQPVVWHDAPTQPVVWHDAPTQPVVWHDAPTQPVVWHDAPTQPVVWHDAPTQPVVWHDAPKGS
jgi:hypothetical protein